MSNILGLPHFTVEEREDFLRILKLMRIDNTLQITVVVNITYPADFEAAASLLSEFIRGRIE